MACKSAGLLSLSCDVAERLAACIADFRDRSRAGETNCSIRSVFASACPDADIFRHIARALNPH